MQQEILEGLPRADLSVAFVWMPMLWGDVKLAAEYAAREYRDARVRHFYDPNKRSGTLIGQQLGAHKDGAPVTAWDIYLFYQRGLVWESELPAPSEWMHQLGALDRAHQRQGEALARELRSSAERLTQQPAPA